VVTRRTAARGALVAGETARSAGVAGKAE